MLTEGFEIQSSALLEPSELASATGGGGVFGFEVMMPTAQSSEVFGNYILETRLRLLLGQLASAFFRIRIVTVVLGAYSNSSTGVRGTHDGSAGHRKKPGFQQNWRERAQLIG